MSGTIQFLNTTPEKLLNEVDKRLDSRLSAFAEEFKPAPPEEYLTKKEVAKMLKVTTATINNYINRGILKSYGLDRIVYFKRTEIEKAIIQLNS